LMADRIAGMNNGQGEQYATPQESYDQPATPFGAEFVGQGNWLPFQRSSDSHAQVGAMSMRLATNAGTARSGRLFCRPEAITVNPVVH
ncbi:spermidine/putrescine ABC transporter ATP-binding protein, partial [Mycobacterium tuberculosis]|nr:spermidine/putrescine ABC transporter ATP-binding protein [Mycobacterium tuberculosis]